MLPVVAGACVYYRRCYVSIPDWFPNPELFDVKALRVGAAATFLLVSAGATQLGLNVDVHNILKRVRDDIEATQDSVWGMFSTYDSQRNFREALMNATMNATSNQEIIDSTDRAQEENNAVVIIMSIMAGFVGLCGLVFAFIQCFKSYYKQHDGALNDGPMTPSDSYLRYGKPPVAYGAPTPDGPPRISSEFFSPHTPIEDF